ncbi:unnamed protein product (macronuclear) [Paramecium tetraurelia]|uniref:NADPH--hemoprotein reductase n=1 Tax=Paramecium tetraurelia TaxID=5888 RepID=A0BDS0_PARTE|nr:uncharacterized protein GSPATT00027717001 [Paramecium tetraurelia]CAK56687.1 unnamed protein product [Paramecium tetraurelia]|eukprot:XP_001424085.1 hypothetical protein (macronuclear) [Paramecium tetraurelia strain d4-2]
MEFQYILLAPVVLLVGIIIYFLKSKSESKQNQQPQQVISGEEKKIQCQDQLIPISIYFGSQQGTAARFAKQLSEEGKEHGFITTEIDLNEVEFENEMKKGKVGIFCMATHGEGDPTDNAKKFISWLQEPQPSLVGFQFAVFGLGNRQYEHYNKIGKLTNNLLEGQKGVRCYQYGEGDANSTLEDDFIDWKKDLWNELKISLKDLIDQAKNCQVQQEVQENPESTNDNTNTGSTFKLVVSNSEEINFDQALQGQYDFQTKQFLKAKYCQVVSISQLRQNQKDGSTLQIIFDTGREGIEYKTAMNLGVYPENDDQQILEIANYLGENLDTVYSLELLQQNNRAKVPFPSPLSVRKILKHFVDFNGQLMKNTLTKLSKISSNDEKLKNQLIQLTTEEGKAGFQNLVDNMKTTIYQLIKENNIKLNLAQFIELCPRISPRLFTIASSNLKNPQHVEIADSLLIDTLPNGTEKLGLCSQYFINVQKKLLEGECVRVRVDFRESSFKLPDDPNKSIIMVGPGTGIAPFIGFLQEREIFLQSQPQRQNEYILYFGCKHQDGDFIYKDQLREFERSKTIDRFYTAFSRDQEQKCYVQDLLKRNSEELYNQILNDKVVIYICGSTSMGNSVQNLIKEILSTNGNWTEHEAEEKIQSMEKQKLLIKELW